METIKELISDFFSGLKSLVVGTFQIIGIILCWLVLLILVLTAYIALGYGIWWLLIWLAWHKTAIIFAVLWVLGGFLVLAVFGAGASSTKTYTVTVTER